MSKASISIGKLQKAHELHVSGKLTIQDHDALVSLRDSITSLTEKLLEGKAPEPAVEEESTIPDDFFYMKKELQKQYMVVEDMEE